MRKNGVDRKCDHCGTTYHAAAWLVARGSRFCSRSCSAQQPHTEQHKRNISRGLRTSVKKIGHPRTRPDCVCQACGKVFRPHQNDRGGRGNLFCSRACWKPKSGDQHPNWSGGRYIRSGYVWLNLPSNERRTHTCVARSRGTIMEHVAKAEQALGRCLKRGEVVHHFNMNKQDNRNSNLLICSASYHAGLHRRMEQAWVREHLN